VKDCEKRRGQEAQSPGMAGSSQRILKARQGEVDNELVLIYLIQISTFLVAEIEY
jgi:hypothetical protein